MTEKEERPSFIVEFASGEAEFGPASYDVWANYLQKIKDDQVDAGDRELAMSCCLSHGTDERLGTHTLTPLLDSEPAALDDIAAEITELSGGDVEPKTVGRTVVLHNMTFRAPNSREWSTYKADTKDSNVRGGTAAERLLALLCDEQDVFKSFIRANPAALFSILAPITKLAGRGIRIKRKKA